MEEPIAVLEDKSEYLKRTDFDAMVDRIKADLTPIIDHAVQNAVRQALQETDRKIELAKDEIHREFQARLNAHAEAESKKRQEEIENVNRRFNEFTTETHKKLGEFNTTVDTAARTITNALQTVQVLSTEVKGWSNVLASSRELYAENRRDIERLEHESDSVCKEQTATTEKLNALHRTIHGGEGENSPSVFSELQRVWEQNREQNRNIHAALEVAKDTAQRLDKFEQERQQDKEIAQQAELERKERWPRRIRSAKSMMKTAAKSFTPYALLLAIIAIVLGMVAIFQPEALPVLMDYFKQFLGATP
jgi:FtsZ-binding cell division protein ZapB